MEWCTLQSLPSAGRGCRWLGYFDSSWNDDGMHRQHGNRGDKEKCSRGVVQRVQFSVSQPCGRRAVSSSTSVRELVVGLQSRERCTGREESVGGGGDELCGFAAKPSHSAACAPSFATPILASMVSFCGISSNPVCHYGILSCPPPGSDSDRW